MDFLRLGDGDACEREQSGEKGKDSMVHTELLMIAKGKNRCFKMSSRNMQRERIRYIKNKFQKCEKGRV
jgi:hypothetical protein